MLLRIERATVPHDPMMNGEYISPMDLGPGKLFEQSPASRPWRYSMRNMGQNTWLVYELQQQLYQIEAQRSAVESELGRR